MNKRMTIQTIVFLALTTLPAFGQGNILTGDLSLPSLQKLDRYLNLDLFYTHDYISNTGGLKAGPRNIGALDIYLETDLSKYSSIKGEMQLHYLHINDHDNRGEIGDMQVASNIDMPSQIDRIADLWYQHNWSDKFKTLVGLHDISMEFNITESSLKFLNSSFGTTSELAYSGTNGPSVYPLTSLGLRAHYQINEELELRTGIYDSDPGGEKTYRRFHSDIGNHEGYLVLSEVAHNLENQKIGLGGWVQSKGKDFEDKTEEEFGFYTMAERSLTDSLSAFFRYGWGSPLSTPIQSNIVTGLVYRGIFQTKKNMDEVGIGVSEIYISEFYRDTLEDQESLGAKEIAYELYYEFKPLKALSLRPDIQYIQNPAGYRKVDDAIAAGMRAVFEI